MRGRRPRAQQRRRYRPRAAARSGAATARRAGPPRASRSPRPGPCPVGRCTLSQDLRGRQRGGHRGEHGVARLRPGPAEGGLGEHLRPRRVPRRLAQVDAAQAGRTSRQHQRPHHPDRLARCAAPDAAPGPAAARRYDGKGYWLIASDGGVFAFGDAGFFGSLGGAPPSTALVGVAPTPDGGGYWVLGANGTAYDFGDAPPVGVAADSPGLAAMMSPMTGLIPDFTGQGFDAVNGSGQAFAYGDAPYFGDVTTAVPGYSGHAVGIAVTPG